MSLKAQKFGPLGKNTKQALCYIRYIKMRTISKTMKV